jgi:hypothetical protein
VVPALAAPTVVPVADLVVLVQVLAVQVPAAALVLVAVVPVVVQAAVPVAANKVCIKQALWSCIL